MDIIFKENIIVNNPNTKHFLADSLHIKSSEKLPLVVFVHGYKGYKDWGAWELLGFEIAKAGFFFVKFNFSHNGTTLKKPNEFADLQAFGENNFTKELSDLDAVIECFSKYEEVDKERIVLLGHSRGGGISIIKAGQDDRVKMIITLASISDFESRFPKGTQHEEWKEKGVYYVQNARTGQQLPHTYQFYEDFVLNKNEYSISRAVKSLKIPYLILHGSKDEAVSMEEGLKLNEWCKTSEFIEVCNANHTFGTKEPWEQQFLSTDMEFCVKKIVEFLHSKM